MKKDISLFVSCCICRPSAASLHSISNAARTVLFSIVLMFATLFCSRPVVGDDHNPIGVTGAFEGVTTTGSAYNVLNHNATRQIDDMVVPGSIGKYPLKMTRYYNSRDANFRGLMGPGWTHEYQWTSSNDKVRYPNGNVWNSHCTDFWGLSEGPLGVSDWPTTWNGYRAFRLADGGTVVFENPNWAVATKIIDPYGQVTTITLDPASGLITRVTEPGGRYLQFIYTQQPAPNSQLTLTTVEAHGLGNATVTDSVTYTYASKPTGGNTITSAWCLSAVTYSDGQQATYTYSKDNTPENPSPPCPCPLKLLPLLQTAQDVRYKGPMRQICFEYQVGGPHGAIIAERYSLNGSTTGSRVSRIDPPAPSPLFQGVTFPTTYTEYRGDGPTRRFNYTALSISRPPNEDECPSINGPAPQQFLQSHTDFRGNSTVLGYDANWYVNSIRDANNNTTSYVRGSPPPDGIGEVLTITHPDGSHIDYTYDDDGHYVHTLSNERQKVTTYTRDPTTHLVTRIDYPQDANTPASSEVFTYNNFGQVLTHQLKNGAWESFVYDNRGLLTDKYNPKATLPSGGDPHTHYTYYTSGPWTDRVMTMTLPANAQNLQASETYEYDRALGADGTTDPAGAAVAGRGLVTKITHADTPTNTYQSFGYDAYGNKMWEENELRQRTSYTYDEYNRVLTIKDPIGQTTGRTTTYTYGASPYLQTANNPDTVTTPAGIVTSNVYDENLRKISSAVAGLAAWFHYDNVGNQDWVSDPRGTAGRTWPNADPAYATYTDYDSRNRKWRIREPLGRTTQLFYEDGINLTRINRPDGTNEWKTYDALNRMIWDTVMQTNSIPLNTYFNYNPSGTLAWMSDPNEHYTSFYYDASDQRVEMIYHDGSIQWWNYDDAHNLKSRITVNGEWQIFSFDIRNRKYANWWTNWSNNIVDWRYFGYDPASRLIEAENGTGGWGANIVSDIHRTYDAAGHLTLEQQIVTGLGTKNVNYPTYDDDGRLTRMYVTGASGYDFTYSYDAMGRFEKIFLTNSSQLFQYHYDAASNETERDNLTANGVNQFSPRDALNRMTSWDAKKGASTLAHEGYTYDPMNRIRVVDWANGHTDSFDYYLDGELKTANLGNFGHNITYNIDKMGNRTSVVDNNVSTGYTPNAINQYYPTAAGSSITNGPEHEISAYNGVAYTYINDERLKSAATGNSAYTLTYDALGRCMKRRLSNGPTTYYVYDGEKPILEYDANGTSVGTNVYGKGIDEILERVAIGSDNQSHVYFLQQNHEGSVTLLTDLSGNVLERYRYDAFGAPTIYSPTWATRSATIYDNRFLFTGREYAATYRSTYNNVAFNFYEYRARAYHPTLGRFMSEDPKLFDAGDYNLFRYCHNDPIDFTDPMGLASESEPTHSPRETSHERAEEVSAPRAVWERQMKFSASRGAIAEAYDRIASSVQQFWNRVNPPPRPGLSTGTIVAAAPIEEAPAAIAGLGRLISRMFRVSEEGATVTRAMWVGRDGELAARASGAQLLRPSKAAVEAARAGDWSLMRTESAAWAAGARGYVPVFFGKGKGRIFLGDELPKLLNNMNAGKVQVIDITF